MNNVFLFSMPGGMEWVIILFAILLLFGGKKIPELMRGFGKGMREFKNAKDNINSELEEGMKEHPSIGPDKKRNDTAMLDFERKSKPFYIIRMIRIILHEVRKSLFRK